ncbi:MAG: hypothetical protein KBD01_06820 [Acidobacteria bacterium]|nr:hypothetical protein [Acidobacteriota bacterium]
MARIVGAAMAALLLSAAAAGGPGLPERVTRALLGEFPRAEIVRFGPEGASGVLVYVIEFQDAGAERACDITADGTILAVSVVVATDEVPPAALATIREASAGANAAIWRIKRMEVRATPNDGKVVSLEQKVTRYEAEFRRIALWNEVVVAEDGTIVERIRWYRAGGE